MAIGRHCAHSSCQQLDFLPFKCRKCAKVYCLEHRNCPCTEGSQETVLVCPLCAKAVVCPPGEDPELVFDRHTRTECDPSNYDRVHRKPRCPVAGCKEKLTTTNTYTCRDCAVTVCLKHRLPSDHKCPGKAATAVQNRLSLPQSWRRVFSSGSGSATAVAGGTAARPQQQAAPAGAPAPVGGSRRPTVAQKAAAVAGKTKESMQAQLQQYRQQQRQRGQPVQPGADVVDLTTSPAATAMRGPAATPTGPELCQQCGARFASVQQLIEHAGAVHAAGWSSGDVDMQQQQQAPQPPRQAAGPSSNAGSSGLESCPHCGRQFADPVQLVEHVERQHGAGAAGRSDGTCVLC